MNRWIIYRSGINGAVRGLPFLRPWMGLGEGELGCVWHALTMELHKRQSAAHAASVSVCMWESDERESLKLSCSFILLRLSVISCLCAWERERERGESKSTLLRRRRWKLRGIPSSFFLRLFRRQIRTEGSSGEDLSLPSVNRILHRSLSFSLSLSVVLLLLSAWPLLLCSEWGPLKS